MNPATTLRLRRLTSAFAVLWVLLAFLAGLGAKLEARQQPTSPFNWVGLGGVFVVAHVTPDAEAAGVRVGDRLIGVDGVHVDEWLREARAHSPLLDGQSNRYQLERSDGSRYAAPLPPVPTGVRPRAVVLMGLATSLLGAIYFAIGFGVWWLKRDREESWALLLFCSAMAASLFCGGFSNSPAVYYIEWLTAPFIGASIFHLFTTYPIEPAWIAHHRRWRFFPYGVAAALAALMLLSGPLALPLGSLDAPLVLFSVGLGSFCVVSLARERRRRADAAAGRADVMLLGAILSFTPIALVLSAQYFLRLMIPLYFGLPFLLIFPLSVGYGIVRRQLFDIRIAARSSLVYGVATLAITGLYALVIASADAAVADFNVNARSPWFSVSFLFFAILAFNPLRNRLQGLVDRVFDRDRAGYRHALREISDAMVSMLSLREICDRILVALTETMGVERAVVLLLDDGERRLVPAASRGDWDEGVLDQDTSIDHPIVRSLWMRREELARGDFDDEPDPEIREVCRDVFDTLELELLVPILFGVDLLGAIGIGRKFSGERIDADDRQLLRTLTNQSAIAIENAKSYDEIAQLNETLEARVDERTRELRDTQAQLVQNEKMVSLGQLVAGVAHELNNPIGFIHANLQLIDEYIAKLTDKSLPEPARAHAREALEKLLASSREGTQRVKRIVEDMRTFSRLDQAELLEVDLHEGIDRTLSLMTPRLKHGIQVERDYGELPQVRCFAGQLNQVFMNLLMNACDALVGSGTIRISTRATTDGVRLAFEDDGPGIPEEIRNRLFEPFFTTKTIGKGTGLGLSISHGIVQRHGGSIRVESKPGEGATFVIELPLDALQEKP
jgi:signal transduction histidine kinase